jgi:hydrogenase maturation protease
MTKLPLRKATGFLPEILYQLLIIGYGNTLRSDDGVGIKIAEAVSDLKYAGVETLCCALLTPELAEPISRSGKVVFVDASVESPRQIHLYPLQPAESSQFMAHAADPRTLLALARDVFGHTPKAWLLTIPIKNLEIGEELSPLARQGFNIAMEKLRQMVLND